MRPFVRLSISLLLIVGLTICHKAQADVLYQADFSTFSNGGLTGQDGWDAQADWQISGGMATNSGNWTRARQTTGFTLSPNNSVRMTLQFSLSGSGTGSELARFGIAKSNEHTGANMPQVFAEASWNGSDLTVGGATINNYSSGETVSVEITFTMQPETDSWERTTVLDNLSDPASAESTDTVGDSAGNVTTETAWAWLNGGGSAYFGLRTFDNPTALTLSVATVLFEINVNDDPEIATPNTLQSESGLIASGELGDVVESDDEYLEYFPDVPSGSNPFAVSLEFRTFLSNSQPGEVTLNFESSSNTPGLSQVLDVFNWGTQQFENVEVRSINVTDSTSVLVLDDLINVFVNENTGEIRLRSRWVKTSPVIFYPWRIRIDQVMFEYR